MKAKAGDALAEDPAFLRRLKPSLVAARMKGEAAPDPVGPSGPQLERPAPKKKNGGGSTSPWLVLGAALAVGYLLAKAIDWRSHAHPRR